MRERKHQTGPKKVIFHWPTFPIGPSKIFFKANFSYWTSKDFLDWPTFLIQPSKTIFLSGSSVFIGSGKEDQGKDTHKDQNDKDVDGRNEILIPFPNALQ